MSAATIQTGPLPERITITIWRSATSSTNGKPESLSWPALVDRYTEAGGKLCAKEKLPALGLFEVRAECSPTTCSAARKKDKLLPAHRCDAAVTAIHAIAFDHDHHEGEPAVTWDAAVDWCKAHGLACILYESPSNMIPNDTDGSAGPRWRLVVPLAEPWTDAAAWSDAYSRIRMLIEKATGVVLDSKCQNPSRFFYPPARPIAEASPRKTLWIDGKALSLARTLASLPAPPPPKQTAIAAPPTTTHGNVEDRARRYLSRCDAAISGQGGHAATFHAAQVLVRGFGLPRNAALRILRTDYNPRCQPPWTDEELEHKIDSALTDGEMVKGSLLTAPPPRAAEHGQIEYDADGEVITPPPSGKTAECSDLSNAERLVREHGKDLRYCKSRGGWLFWDSRRWMLDERGHVHRCAKSVARRMLEAALEKAATATAAWSAALAAGSPDAPKKLEAKKAADARVKWASRSQNAKELTASITVASSEPSIPVGIEELDQDPYVLNVLNGVLDLRTGKLGPHDRGRMLTKLAPVTFDPKATAPTWDRFLAEVLPDPEVRAFVQRLAGYAMTGVVKEHVLPVFWGGGANGKSTLTTTLQTVLGEYARQIPSEMLMVRPMDAHPSERATLLGLRLAVAAESEQGKTLAESLIKQLTGGDKIAARFMHHDWFDFAPTHKLILATNHRPRIRGTDKGIWRRVALVPFNVTIPDDKIDTELGNTLMAEASGILNWALEGCRQWQAKGLGRPDAVMEATRDYQVDQDLLADFFDECCVIDPKARVKATELFKGYEAWCSNSGGKAVSQTAFGEAMTERGFERRKIGTKQYMGIRLLTELERRALTREPGPASGTDCAAPVRDTRDSVDPFTAKPLNTRAREETFIRKGSGGSLPSLIGDEPDTEEGEL